jgi:hypothetical protein
VSASSHHPPDKPELGSPKTNLGKRTREEFESHGSTTPPGSEARPIKQLRTLTKPNARAGLPNHPLSSQARQDTMMGSYVSRPGFQLPIFLIEHPSSSNPASGSNHHQSTSGSGHTQPHSPSSNQGSPKGGKKP